MSFIFLILASFVNAYAIDYELQSDASAMDGSTAPKGTIIKFLGDASSSSSNVKYIVGEYLDEFGKKRMVRVPTSWLKLYERNETQNNKSTAQQTIKTNSTNANSEFNQANSIPSQKPTEDVCSNVDLRSRFKPTRNQDGFGWCTTYAGADLLGFYQNDHISALDMAIEYIKHTAEYSNHPIPSISGFDISDVVRVSTAVGYCTEDKLPSNDVGRFTTTEKDFIENGMLRTMITKTPISMKTNLNSLYSELAKIRKKVETTGSYDCNTEIKNLENMNFGKFNCSELAEALSKPSLNDAIIVLKDKRCKARKKYTFNRKPEVLVSKYHKTEDILKKLNDTLKKNEPVYLSIHSNLFALDKDDLSKDPTADLHGVLIVGRKKNQSSGKCEYIIRNSWGRSCLNYDETFKKRCDSEGQIWITDDELKGNLTHILTMDPTTSK